MKSARAPAVNGWHIACLVFCTLMLILHVAAGYNAGSSADFRRDVYWATKIAYGEDFPLSGPPIFQLVELGPWWYYILAPAIRLCGSIMAATIWMQALVALKYFLAWHLGTRMLDARFGFVLAASVAATGWAFAPLLFASHPALVETTLLLLALATWNCRDALTWPRALGLGLAAAACLHAHPTTVTWILLAGSALLLRHRNRHALVLLGLAATIMALSLSPPWFDSRPLAAGVNKAVGTYIEHDFAIDPLSRFVRMLTGLFFNGAWTGFSMMTPWKIATARLAWYLYCACLALTCGGVFMLPRDLRKWFANALLLVLCQCAFLVLVRANMPVWMLFSALPMLAFVIALGAYGWLSVPASTARPFGASALAVQVALSLAAFSLFLRHDVRALRIAENANPYVDATRHGEHFKFLPIAFFTMRQIDTWGAIGCEPVILHGRLAQLMENVFAIPLRSACGRWPEVRFRGTGGEGPHWLGIELQAVNAVGITPDDILAGMAIYRHVRAIAPAEGNSRTELGRMQVEPQRQRSEPGDYSFEAYPRDAVSLTGIGSAAVTRAIANGHAARLAHERVNQLVYVCDACAGDTRVGDTRVRWEIKTGQAAYNLDIAVIEAH